MLAVEHEPGEVRLQRVPVLLQESLHVVRHRAGKMFDPTKKSTFENCVSSSVADPESMLWCFFDPWIRDPGWKKIRMRDLGSRIRDDHGGLYFRELR